MGLEREDQITTSIDLIPGWWEPMRGAKEGRDVISVTF